MLKTNFLCQAIGSAISLLREGRVEDYAKSLDMGLSAYKMMEAGNCHFPLDSLLLLIKIHPEIQFDKFANVYSVSRAIRPDEEEISLRMMCIINPSLEPIIEYWLSLKDEGDAIKSKTHKKELGRMVLGYICSSEENTALASKFFEENPELVALLKKLSKTLRMI